ncbi:MAG: hypothetical protein JWM18_1291, partial [Chloroflexi bacterium]|nr:hypothetical protein [Chloroflexota bacterium]
MVPEQALALATVTIVAVASSCVQATTGMPAPRSSAGVSPASHSGSAMTEAVPTGNAPIRIVEQAYALWAEPESAIVTLATPQGRVYTTLPLAVRSGRTSLAPGFRARTQVSDGNLLVRLTDAGGAL